MTGFQLILIVSGFSLLADVVLKRAADVNNMFLLVLGCGLYVLDAIFWFYAYKYSKFSTVGVNYSLIILLLSVLIGIFVFKEKINTQEVVGIVLGILAIIFLSKFK